MKNIHFTSRTITEDGDEVYHLTIDGKEWTYNRDTDFLENVKTGYLIERSELQTQNLKAFHKAWDPDLHASVCENIPMNSYGFPMANEDPNSPLYDPARPTGYPVELRKQCEQQDAAHEAAALLAAYNSAIGSDGPDDVTARRVCQAINSISE